MVDSPTNQIRSERSKIRVSTLVLITGGLLVLSALSLAVDVDVTRNRRSQFLAGDFRRIIQLSEIFAHGFGIAVVLYLLWVLAPQKRRWMPRLAACAILPGLIVQFMKLFVARYRPGHYFPEFTDRVANTWIGFMPNGQWNTEYVTQSFPSAHAATAVGFAIGMIWFFPACRHLFVALAFLSSIQRVVAGAHWLSDVFFGAAVSVVVCGFIFRHHRIDAMFCLLEKKNQGQIESSPGDANFPDESEVTSRAA